MDMNDKDWGDEIWDNEPDEDDEFNDIGSDVDANNDETFDNAAEWNEDEHEEMIARDSILSHSSRTNNHSSNNRASNNINNNNNIRLSHSNNNSSGINNNNNAYNHNSSDAAAREAYFSNVDTSAGRGGWNSIGDPDPFPVLTGRLDHQQSQSTSAPWLAVQNTTDRLHQLQLQQQQLLMQKRLQEQEQQQKQQLRDRQMMQRERDRQQTSQQFDVRAQAENHRQVLRVDELERQFLKTRISQDNPNLVQKNLPQAHKRTGWSPFGGKDLFTSPESPTQSQLNAMGQNVLINAQPSQALTLEQQQQLLIQQNLLQQQQLALLKQQQIQQEQRLMSQNPQCFTVEELERKMIAERSTNTHDNKSPRREYCFFAAQFRTNDKPDAPHNTHHRRDGDNHERDVRESRDRRERKEYHRNHRDGRDHKREHDNRQSIIIPPQVQLSVIDKAKRLHSITAMHPDEFLQDRMPTSREGFPFKRHSKSSDDRIKHDGVLTEKERNWLTKIQEKIQADYDDNLDQDYYYLLYFNRFSMTDEAAQKPCGPGVLDRRFIPRERLLYNSSN